MIQWHVLGMFAAVLVNLQGISQSDFLIGLMLLGVGWNFLFIGSTNLITEAYLPTEKAKVQGVNEMLVSLTVMLAGFLAGVLQNLYGWQLVNQAELPLLLLVASSLILFERQRLSDPAIC